MIVGIGTDICSVPRLRRVLRRHGERFLERVFTPEERAYCTCGAIGMEYPDRVAEGLAARFAAKEAAMKALGTGWRAGVRFVDIGVSREPSGQPVLVLKGAAGRRAQELGVTRAHLSLSHEREYAVALVVLEATGE